MTPVTGYTGQQPGRGSSDPAPPPAPPTTARGTLGKATPPEEPSHELPDVFCGLGSLIVEGRLPNIGSDRGYGEGPHVPMPGNLALSRQHECSSTSYMVRPLMNKMVSPFIYE